MPKIAVERPRYNHCDRYPRAHVRNQYGSDLESHPTREAHGRFGTKGLSENLSPLFRFLCSNVGRPWDKVWSEMCAHISFDNAVQKHIFAHIDALIEARVELRGREVYAITRRWRSPSGAPLRGYGRWPTLYVCPKSGLLKQAKHERRRRQPDAADPDVVAVTDLERLHRVLGIWYREHLVRAETGALVVARKRQLRTRELAQLGLKEQPR